MKKTILFNLMLATSIIGYAQAEKATQNLESPKDFFKSSQARYSNAMANAEGKLVQQAAKIETLKLLNASLKEKGNISVENFQKFEAQIAAEKMANDSLMNISKDLKGLVSSASSTKRHLTKIINFIPAFNKAVVDNEYYKFSLFGRIERELNSSNLGGEKKALTVVLGKATEQQAKETKKIDNIGNDSKSLLEFGKIDSVTAQGVDSRMQKYVKKMEENAKELKTLETSISNPEEYAANSVSIKSRVYFMDSVINQDASKREYTFKMIEEGIKKSTKTLFSLAAFFGPGGYSIPADKQDKASVYFAPLVDSLIAFSNKYAELPRTATVLVNGYADATQIGKGSELYNKIADYTKIVEPTKEQLNLGLSTLRAEELSKLFANIAKQKANKFVALPKITFENIEVGRGEQLPDDSITDYKVNDERRRIVVVYWSVLPN